MWRLIVILVTVLASAATACFVWRDLLAPPLPPLPPEIPLRQRQFGANTTAGISAALDRPLPGEFVTRGDFDGTVDALREATGLNFFVNWPALEAEGIRRDTPTPTRDLGGMAAGDAVLRACSDLSPAVGCRVGDDVVSITTLADASDHVSIVVYDVRDLVADNGAMARLEGDVESHVSPGSWRGGEPDTAGSLRSLSGQLIVTATPATQYEVARHLNDLRVRGSRVRFAQRAGTLVGGATAAVCLLLLGHFLVVRRRRNRGGLCTRCGYDLRMTPTRCPECGATVGEVAAA